MKYLLLMMLIVINSLDAISQREEATSKILRELPSDSTLIKSLVEFYQKDKNAKLVKYDIQESKSWLKYLPNLGITYNLQGQPRPSLSYSPISIINSRKQDKLRNAEKLSVEMSFEVLLSDRVGELLTKIREYELKKEIYKEFAAMIEIEEQLYLLEKKKYEANLIKPSQYLNAKKRAHQVKVSSLNKLHEITELYSEIIAMSKFNSPAY